MKTGFPCKENFAGKTLFSLQVFSCKGLQCGEIDRTHVWYTGTWCLPWSQVGTRIFFFLCLSHYQFTSRSRAQLLWGKGLLKCQCQMINNAVANTGLATRHFNWDAFELKISSLASQLVDLSSQQVLMAEKKIYTASKRKPHLMFVCLLQEYDFPPLPDQLNLYLLTLACPQGTSNGMRSN